MIACIGVAKGENRGGDSRKEWMDGFLDDDAIFFFVGMAGEAIPVLTGEAGNAAIILRGNAVSDILELPARGAWFPVYDSVSFVLARRRRKGAARPGLGNRRNKERL